jgi:hypothetical protein
MSNDWASYQWFVLLVKHFSFAMFILAIILSFFEWVIQRMRHRAICYDILFRWIALFPLGVTSLYLFVMFSIFPNVIGSAESLPIGTAFYTLGIANLAIGLIAVIAFFKSYDFRVATVIASTVWLWGSALGQIYLMMVRHVGLLSFNSWFWINLIIPFILITCIIKLRPGDLTVYNP